jgi:hypothetical protein
MKDRKSQFKKKALREGERTAGMNTLTQGIKTLEKPEWWSTMSKRGVV